mgnify:CR=1 FL=1
MEKRFITIVEAGEILGLRPETLRKWAAKGYGPRVYHLGGAVRYKLEQLIEWSENRGVENA